jgi:hypothetical protein
VIERSVLKRSTLAFRHLLEGYWDDGAWVPGDLELVLRGYGIFRDRDWLDRTRLPHLSDDGRMVRARLESAITALIPALPERESREPREALREAAALYIREAAYTWFNRLVALRCLEARVPGADEAIKIKPDYADRSLRHDRFCRQYPELCQGEDGGLVAFLREVCTEAAKELSLLFDSDSPLTLVAPSPDALQKCIRALSGEAVDLTRLAGDRAEGLTDDVFCEPDLLGWVYQYWNDEEKDRVFEAVARGKKITGADIIPATCIYTEDYMVRFLVENSLGALWAEMHPDSRLSERWQYFVRDVERHPSEARSVDDLTFIDPACGSGHFLVYAFDLLWDMYQDEGRMTDPADICRSILERNLYGIDIDERSVQIAAVTLYLKAKERAPHFTPHRVNLVAANASMPPDAVQRYLKSHPDDEPLRGVLETIFEGLENVNEVGSLLQIDEQLDRAIEDLRKREVRRANIQTEQLSLLPLLGLPEPAAQGRLDLDMLPPWEAWKQAVLDRLHEQFQWEANATDLSTAIFGADAERGLDLIELLSRRYDVVATNPPYMGLKNMGQQLKAYVQQHYREGKRDLYVAFIQRALQLARYSGKVAMVAQQAWMFLRSFAELRKGILREQTIEFLAHLGPHAFEEISGEVVNTALFVLTQELPAPQHKILAFRLVGLRRPDEKAERLRSLVLGDYLSGCYSPLQLRLLSIYEAPISYWLSAEFLELLLMRPRLGDRFDAAEGLGTRDDHRFTRKFWEVRAGDSDWVPLAKGGGYLKWAPFDENVVFWDNDGLKIKEFNSGLYGGGHWSRQVRNTDKYFKRGLCYSKLSRGSLAVRELPAGWIFGEGGPAIFGSRVERLMPILNSRVVTYIMRAFTPQLEFRFGYLLNVPVPFVDRSLPWERSEASAWLVTIKEALLARNVTRRGFQANSPSTGDTLLSYFTRLEQTRLCTEAVLLTAEGGVDQLVTKLFGLSTEAIQTVTEETGTPAAWHPLLKGYDANVEAPSSLPPVPAELCQYLYGHELLSLSSDGLQRLKGQLSELYSSGPGVDSEDEAEDQSSASAEEESEDVSAVSVARIPVPAETFLEELSHKLKIHPISVYWLLKELWEQDGVVCISELRRYVADYFTVMILRLLSHRWPKQIEANEPTPKWADPDGIIPLTDGTGQRTLLDRVRERIAADFSEARVDAIEQEFRQIMGRSLIGWLVRDFFPHHVSQFKRRPIAWMLESGRALDTRWEAASSRRGRRSTRMGGPAFACLVYYHKLTADTLTRIKTHYLRPVLQRREFELAEERRRAAEGNIAAHAEAERLAGIVDELKTFEAALDIVNAQGFLSRRLGELLAREEPDHWARRMPKSAIPDKEVFLRQEQAYDPDLNDGVRVNIAPLQKYRLLAADVLASKDVERAIQDRATWRSDERRWCHEGKLPKPGWWQDRD